MILNVNQHICFCIQYAFYLFIYLHFKFCSSKYIQAKSRAWIALKILIIIIADTFIPKTYIKFEVYVVHFFSGIWIINIFIFIHSSHFHGSVSFFFFFYLGVLCFCFFVFFYPVSILKIGWLIGYLQVRSNLVIGISKILLNPWPWHS